MYVQLYMYHTKSCTCGLLYYRLKSTIPAPIPAHVIINHCGPDTCIQASLYMYMAQEAEPQGSSYMYPRIDMITVTQKGRTS